MAVGTAFPSAAPTRYPSTGWTAYGTGVAQVWNTVSQSYLSDSNDLTWVQMVTAPSSGRGNLVMATGDVALTAGSAIVRGRIVGRVGGNGNFSVQYLNAGNAIFAALSSAPAATAIAEYVGGWTLPTGGTAWSTATINAGSIYADTGNTNLRLTQLRMEYDMYSIPTHTITTSSNTDKPVTSWVYTDTDGVSQSSAVVKMYTAAQYGAGGFSPDTSTATFSTVLAGDGTTVTSTTAVGPTATVYRSYIQVIKDVYSVPVRSAWSSAQATLSFTAPNAGTVTPTFDDTYKRVQLSVAGSASPFRYTVTRGGTTIGTALTTMPVSGAAVFYDYQAPRGTAVVYSLVMTTGTAASPQLSSTTSTGTVTTGTATSWELQSLEDPTTIYQFASPVTSISFTRMEGQSVLRPLDATKAVVVSGALTGDDGTLNWTTSTRSSWETLKTVLTAQSPLRVTSPFLYAAGGNESWVVRLTSRDWSSSGVAANPVQTVTASFVEVNPVDYGL
jgi:hypothetical protein